MSRPPTIAIEFVAKTVQAAVRSGIEQQTILMMSSLRVEDIIDRTKQVPLREYIQLLEDIATLSQDDCFGLHHGATHHLSDFGVLGYILLNSATVGCALNNLIRYFGVWQQATNVALTIEGDTAWFSYQISEPAIQTRRQDTEAAMAFGLTMIRTLTRQHFHPKAVWFEHESPVDISEHQRVFNAPLFFNQSVNAMAMEWNFLDQKIPLADQSLLPLLESHLQPLLEQRTADGELIASASQAIARSLPQGCAMLEEIASSLGMGGRTLQRYLRDHNVTFKQLVDETRHRRALIYLKDPKLSLTEVALLLGYSELSAFSHAFRRWRGLTPREYRYSDERM